MKITHIVYSGLGGAFSVTDSLINNQNSKNNQSVIYVGPSITSEFNKKNKNKSKNKFYHIRTIKFFSLFYFITIFNKLLKFKPDIIVLHNFQILPCILIKIIYSTKVIFVDHQSLNTKNYRDNIIISVCKLFVDHFVVLNQDNYKLLNQQFMIDKKKITLIPNGVDLQFYKKRKRKRKKNFLKIGMAGRINFMRNHELIINSLNSPTLKHLDINCSFPGEGELKETLKKIIIEKNLDKKIIFNNNLNKLELKKWYLKLDLYIQASKGEGLSISMLQSMALGIPVLGSNVSGIKNILDEKKNIGILFQNNKASLSNKIKYFFLMKQEQRNNISKKQNLLIKENFSETKMINRYNDLFNKILKII
jgi:glycosyltransferase involved in cell wall biosynthesis